jgi:LmbE family N-acetylglucosaminyl deacetylase
MKEVFGNLVRGIYRQLLPAGAKRALRQWTMFDQPECPPAVVDAFDESRVLVLAPHMDDEVVGCGGVLALHARSGARITVVYLTDGASSDPTLEHRTVPGPQREAARRALSERRKREAREAADVIGIAQLEFLDRPDGALMAAPSLVSEVSELIRRYRPDIVYFPCALEMHPDHFAAARLLAALADSGGGHERLLCRAYEAWTPLLPNRIADVSDVFDVKISALRKFESQLEHVDYVRAITGLNAYRAMTRDGHGYFEAFFEASAAEHALLVHRLDADR